MSFVRSAALGVVVAMLSAGAVFWNMQNDFGQGDALPYAYLELKVIDTDGRPVAGADVRQGDKPLGTTDTFGEWRRFMRVRLGSKVAISVSKLVGGARWHGIKNLAIPKHLPSNGELEVAGAMQLTLGESGEEGPSPRSAVAAATSEQVLSTTEATAIFEQMDFSRLWFTTPRTPTQPLEDVLKSITQRSRQLGLQLDPHSEWRLRLTHLDLQGQSAMAGLILVEGLSQPASGPARLLFSFLRNYQASAMATARDILWTTTQHVQFGHTVVQRPHGWFLMPPAQALFSLQAGSLLQNADGRFMLVESRKVGAGQQPELYLAVNGVSPCPPSMTGCLLRTPGVARVAPSEGLQRLKFALHGALPSDARIYASGYAAVRENANVWAYWGEPYRSAMVTVLSRGKIITRSRIDQMQLGGPRLMMQSSRLSRR